MKEQNNGKTFSEHGEDKEKKCTHKILIAE
jgi:hypothetical protein